jgi:glycosyltransferase involved in cell wall biosynthesis
MLNRRNAVTLFHNEDDRQELIKQRIVAGRNSVTVPSSGVNTERFRPGEPHSASRSPVVIMAARLLWDKGVAEFVEAARMARAHGVQARFVIAGAPDMGSTVAISDEQLGLWKREGSVEFLGHRDDMDVLLRDADVAVLPSHHEGIPRFLLEAAASGLPLVATDVGGCRVVARAGVNGVLVPVGQAEALFDALVPLLRDGALRARMGAASRKIALEEFSESDAMAAHLAILRRLGVTWPSH